MLYSNAIIPTVVLVLVLVTLFVALECCVRSLDNWESNCLGWNHGMDGKN